MMQSPLIGAVTAPSDRARRLASHRYPSRSLYLALSGAVSPLGIGRGRITGAHLQQRCSPTDWGTGGTRLLPANRLGSGKLRDWAVAPLGTLRSATLHLACPAVVSFPRTASKGVQGVDR
jgi:hypothetical protein